MMGQQSRTESLFYYFRLEEQIPNDHLLRIIDSHVDFSFVREQLKDFYSSTGRPSIESEVLLRLLLVGYLYGITSERRLMDEVRTHLAYHWFTRLGFDQEIPDHSTFSKNRHGRFRQSGAFRKIFEEMVRRCLEAGFVEGRNVAVDVTLVGANCFGALRCYTDGVFQRKSEIPGNTYFDPGGRIIHETRNAVGHENHILFAWSESSSAECIDRTTVQEFSRGRLHSRFCGEADAGPRMVAK